MLFYIMQDLLEKLYYCKKNTDNALAIKLYKRSIHYNFEVIEAPQRDLLSVNSHL